MNAQQFIPCPNCQQKIFFDARALLQGVQFTCASCNAVVGIATESKPLLQETMQKFDELKQNIEASKKDNHAI